VIQVVGGSYFERCLSPAVRQFYGSGGRAAAALTGRLKDVVLHTYQSDAAASQLKRLAALSGFEVRPHPSLHPIRFEYVHPLQSTRISPPPQLIKQSDPFSVHGDLVLSFGMLEGAPDVHGGVVVYDPQDGVTPRSFRRTGSEADRLAFLCNKGEAARLTGEADPERAAKLLLESEQAEVVVVKGAARGALVLTSDGQRSAVPAYRSAKVFGIGSGDIFGAAFAFFWGYEGRAPDKAADLASRAVRHYVGTRDEKLATDEFLDSPLDPAVVGSGRVYLAGPSSPWPKYGSSRRPGWRCEASALRCSRPCTTSGGARRARWHRQTSKDSKPAIESSP
jgi:hypothetical protein